MKRKQLKKTGKSLVKRKNSITFALMAQLVEQRIRNAWVGGSSPPIGSTLIKFLPILVETLR